MWPLYEILIWVSVDLKVMALKNDFYVPRAQELEPYNPMQFLCHTLESFVVRV